MQTPLPVLVLIERLPIHIPGVELVTSLSVGPELIPDLADRHTVRDTVPEGADWPSRVSYRVGEVVDGLTELIPTGTRWRHPVGDYSEVGGSG